MIIDAHVHIFPDSVRDRREHYCGLDAAFNEVYSNPKAVMVSAGDVINLLDGIEAHGAVVFGFPWADAAICREHNDYVREACEASGGRLKGLGCMSPESGDAGLLEAERCLELGLDGIGEIAAYTAAVGFSSPFFQDLAELLIGHRKTLLLHATESVGHDYPGKDRTDLKDLYDWIAAHPDLEIVLAHWGGGIFFYELMPEVKKAFANVYYDTAASPFLYRPDIYRVALDIVGEERVLLGSDFPLIRPDRYIKEMKKAVTDDRRLEGLLGANAARLFQF